MTKLRVLEMAHDHPSWTAGGTEFIAHDLANHLNKRDGIDARFLAVSTSLQRPDAEPGSLQSLNEDFVLQTGKYDRFSILRADGDTWVRSLKQVFETVRPHIVHLHGLDRIGAEVLPVIRRLLPRAGIVLTLHDYQLICPNDGLMLTVPEGMRCRRAQADACHRCFPEVTTARHALRQAHLLALAGIVDKFIAPSAFLRDRFVEWGIDCKRMDILPNAVFHEEGCVGKTSDATGAPNRFAYFGNISHHKGANVLLDAAARLVDRGTDVQIRIHGGTSWADPGFRDEFDAKLRAAQPITQHFGPYSRSEITDLMERTDWVVVPSIWWENAPLVIHEALAANRPVICSGIGGMVELIEDGINGLHFAPGDAAELADLIADVSRDGHLHRFLAAGNRTTRAFPTYVDEHIALFRGLTGEVVA